MAFWSRIRHSAETWPGLERVAEQRFWDGLTLAMSGERGAAGAIYLFGYVAEILLKTAYYRERGMSQYVDTSQERRTARQWSAGYGRPPNDHDLNYWIFVLERVRFVNHRPINPALLGAIRLRVGIVAGNWSEALRYRDDQPTDAELQEVYNEVDWLLSRYDSWR